MKTITNCKRKSSLKGLKTQELWFAELCQKLTQMCAESLNQTRGAPLNQTDIN